jgi:hydroxymethylglutaryl-CoA lyase
MGFGNPYGDPYDVDLVDKFADILSTLEVKIISLADTIGVSKPDQIKYLFESLTKQFSNIEFGAHLHSNPSTAVEKINAAIAAGCQRFDGAIKGYGGCPMAEDELVGNLATETILSCLDPNKINPPVNMEAFAQALLLADKTFPQ